VLDLKAKLLAAGLVTKDQVDKVEAEQQARRDKKKAPPKRVDDDGARWAKRVAELAAAGKAEQYDAIRGWVERLRLDQAKGLSETAERFHFAKQDGAISWMSVEPDVKAKLGAGEAGIIAFMSNNGLAHAVVPADVAKDVHKIRPEWLRVLHGVTDVGQPEAPRLDEAGALDGRDGDGLPDEPK
jgi:uncharacterized protein YaiL (DUF2058 family)